ncbi:MAG: hypothetical protein AB3N33_02315 [Puniceicoccaceae bacterium]
MIRHFKLPFKNLPALLALLPLTMPLDAGEWTWHTFPGQRHIEGGYPGSEQPYTGYDRSEWISAFGVSPVISEGHDAPFMMMSTDLGAVVYCADGERFQPADLPLSGGVSLGFDPHDGDTGYAVIHKLVNKTICYLYRTRDRGATWERLTEATYYRVQRSLILVDPVPERADHIYLATTQGIKRSLDDGATWSVIPETDGVDIRTMAFNADGSSLYYINGPVRDNELELGDLNLYRLDFTGNDGSYTWQQIRTGDARDIRPHPDDPERAIVLNRISRFHWSEDRGVTNGQNITPFTINNPHYSLINPANPDHILLFGWPYHQQAYFWSTDGGNSWSTFQKEQIDGWTYYTGIVDTAPYNHGNPNGYMPVAEDSLIEGDRFVVGFWPGKPDWVVTYGMTQKTKGPYISKDSGATFEPFGYGGLTKEHTMMAIGSSDDIMAAARIEYGLTRTTNGGLWWASSSNFNDPVLDDIQNASKTIDDGVWLSSTFHGIAIDPDNDAHWIGLYGHNPGWIIRSTDYGETWEKVLEYTDFDIQRLNFYFQARWVFWHRQNTDIIYAGPYKSTDRGQTWNRLPGDFAVTDMSTENGDVLLYRPVGTAGTHYLSTDGGENWNQLPTPSRDPVTFQRPERPDGRWPALSAIDPDPLRDPTVTGQTVRVLIGSRDSILEFNATNASGTEGTYTVLKEGLQLDDDPWLESNQSIYFSAVAFDPRPGKHHIAYATPGVGWIFPQRPTNDKYYRQIYRSEDGGLSWERIIDDADVAGMGIPNFMQVTGPLTVSPNTGKLYVHAWSGMFVYDHEAGGEETWYGYPVQEGRYVDTGPWFNGFVEISADPWIYLYSLDGYGYLPDDSGWIYLIK